MANAFLDELIAQRTRKNPRFPDLVAEAEHRRALARVLAAKRSTAGLSQTLVAARMGTAASAGRKLQAGADVKGSAPQHYCRALGQGFPPPSPVQKVARRA